MLSSYQYHNYKDLSYNYTMEYDINNLRVYDTLYNSDKTLQECINDMAKANENMD